MKNFEVEIEVLDETDIEDIETIIVKALNEAGVDCIFSIEEE